MIGSYRFSVSRMIPRMTQVALQTHKKDLMRETPNFAKRKFLYRLSRSDYEKQWGKDYVKPGTGTRIMSTLLRYMPKIGPFKAMAFKNPTPQTEDLYFNILSRTVPMPSCWRNFPIENSISRRRNSVPTFWISIPIFPLLLIQKRCDSLAGSDRRSRSTPADQSGPGGCEGIAQ